MSTRGVESSLPFISLMDSHQVVCVPEVQLSEDFSTLKEFEGYGHEWQRIVILQHDVI